MFVFRESTVTVTTAGVSTATDCQDTRMVMSAPTEQIGDKRRETGLTRDLSRRYSIQSKQELHNSELSSY